MGSYWLRKKSSLSDSQENEAQGKWNLEVKDAAEGYLKPEESNKS
jgi:subtilisin-like proprotein convertase family protein